MGRIALWLDPEDLRWLATRCCCGEDASELEQDRCARVRFRASAALHKAASGAQQKDLPAMWMRRVPREPRVPRSN
jgi:hypothetical protein